MADEMLRERLRRTLDVLVRDAAFAGVGAGHHGQPQVEEPELQVHIDRAVTAVMEVVVEHAAPPVYGVPAPAPAPDPLAARTAALGAASRLVAAHYAGRDETTHTVILSRRMNTMTATTTEIADSLLRWLDPQDRGA